MGAWIEITETTKVLQQVEQSHPTMGAWIEIPFHCQKSHLLKSHPTMGAWIEIKAVNNLILKIEVAPHDGCVD